MGAVGDIHTRTHTHAHTHTQTQAVSKVCGCSKMSVGV